jgi:hypothetical protein
MTAEESIRDVATCDLHLAQHQQLWAEIVAREETYDQAVAMGQELQVQDRHNAREVFNLRDLYCHRNTIQLQQNYTH